MPVHSYTISNATGATIRADLNNALSAIVTNNSSNSEPATKYAYMWWADTSAGLLKIRNSDNNAWITLFQLDGTLTLEDGSDSAPAIGFRDDDNTGIFSSAADNLDITTGGTTRVNVSSAGINVTGTVTDDGASHDGDVTFIGASANINFDKSDNALEFADNAKAVFGSDSDDLSIYHNGTDSYIQNETNDLFIDNNGDDIVIRTADAIFFQVNNNENAMTCLANAGVLLYHNNVKVFETISTGVQVTENLGVGTSPSHLIHAKNSSVSSTKIVVESTGTDSYPAFRIINDARSYDFGIDGATDNLRIYDVNGTAERLVVNSDGHIDIPGNLDVGAGIDVTGNIIATGQIKIDGDGGSKYISVGDNEDFKIYHDASGPTIFSDPNNQGLKISAKNLNFTEYTGTTTRFRINDDGHVDVTGNLDVGAGIDVTGNITVSGTVDGVDIAARDTLFGGLTSSSGVLTNGVTATTQSAGDNSTKVATTAYTDTAISNLVDSSPSTLNTLNELAAALGDDANFSTTVTNSIATKMPLAGGEFTGNITTHDVIPDSNAFRNIGSSSVKFNQVHATTFHGSGANLTNLPSQTDNNFTDADHSKLDGIESGATADQTASEIVSLLSDQNITTSGTITATGNGITISGSSASLTLTDDGDDPDYRVQNNNGQFRIFDYTNGANRFSINTSGVVDIAGRLDANGGLDVTGALNVTKAGGVLQTIEATDSNQSYLKFINSTTGNGTFTDGLLVGLDADETAAFWLYENKNMRFATNGTERLTINADGHIDVAGNLDVGAGLDVTGNITTTGDIRVPDDKSIFLGGSDDFKFMHRSSDNISVIKESGGSDLSIETNGSKAQFYDSVNGRNMAEFNVGGACSFKHGATTRLETLSDGVNVIGTLKINGSAISTGGLGNVVEDTSPQLGGDLQSNGNDIDFADGDKAIFGTDSDLQIYHDESNSHILDNGTGDLRVTTNGAKIDFQKSGGEVLARFITDGSVELYEDGTKRFETTDFGVTVQGGITFGSNTAAANQLDAYEEGTWTPTLTFGGATTNITYTSLRFGNYTKIGRQVTVNFAFKLQNKGTTTGDAMVAGLPFAVEDLFSDTTVEANGVSSYWNNVATDSANIVFAAVGGQSQINVRHTVGAQEVTEDMQDNDFANNTTLRGSITYFTAT